MIDGALPPKGHRPIFEYLSIWSSCPARTKNNAPYLTNIIYLNFSFPLPLFPFSVPSFLVCRLATSLMCALFLFGPQVFPYLTNRIYGPYLIRTHSQLPPTFPPYLPCIPSSPYFVCSSNFSLSTSSLNRYAGPSTLFDLLSSIFWTILSGRLTKHDDN